MLKNTGYVRNNLPYLTSVYAYKFEKILLVTTKNYIFSQKVLGKYALISINVWHQSTNEKECGLHSKLGY